MTTGGQAGALALLALLVAAVAGRRGKGKAVAREAWDPMWVWPVPTWVAPDGVRYESTVSSGFGSPRFAGTPDEHAHSGLDIMYKRRSRTDRPEYPAGVKGPDNFANASPMHFAPPNTPIMAARTGRVWSVTNRPDKGGWSVVIDHGKPFATYYTHLASVAVKPGQMVAMGQQIGIMGASLKDGAHLRHLHFEIWYDGRGPGASVDAWGDGVMQSWPRTEWS